MDIASPAIEEAGMEQTRPGQASKLKRWIGLSLVALSFVLYGGLLLD